MLLSQIEKIENKIKEMDGNVMYYRYDDATKTLYLMGNQGEGANGN